jgi:hypothetical protein
MTRLFEKADQLLAMSRGNVITGLTFSRHSSGVSGSFKTIHPLEVEKSNHSCLLTWLKVHRMAKGTH